MQARRRAFSAVTAAVAPRPDRDPGWAPGAIVGGELGRASGLGEGARLMAAALEQAGVPVWHLQSGLNPGEDRELGPPPAQIPPPPNVPLLLHVNAPLLPACLWRLPRALPAGRRVVGYWVWELPVLPPEWRAGLRFVHEIWTPSRFSAAAIETIAPGRVRVVPHPVAACPPVPSALDRAAFGLPGGVVPVPVVVVLVSFNLASSFARKNPLAAIAAFRLAFGDRADRLLLLKISHPGHAPNDMRRLREAAAAAANIRFETRVFSTADTHALTAAADIVLSLHRSEGFGLVCAESMSLGRPVIATDWSGTTDYLDARSGVPIGYRLVPAEDDRGVYAAAGARWAEADVGEAAAALTRLADDAEARRALGQQARRAVAARLGAGPLLQAYRDLKPAAAA